MNGQRAVGENGERLSLKALCAHDNSQRSKGGNGSPSPSERSISLDSVSHPLARRVVTLAFLSERISASLISAQLARSLCAETEATVVLVRFESQNGQGATDKEVPPDLYLNGEFHMPPQVRKTEAGFYSLIVGVEGDPPSPAGIASLISQLSRHFRFVLIETPANERSAPWLLECLVRSDLAYLFLEATSPDVHHLEVVTREVRARCRNDGAHVKPIGCLADGDQIQDQDLLVERVAGPMHMFVRGCPMVSGLQKGAPRNNLTGSFGADLRRLAREVCGRLVGLALSSGAAKGFAHIGVIQVLEENGIEVDVVAGASMGAYVGSLWAYGCDGTELERLAREMEGRWSLWTLIDPVFPPRQGFLRGHAVKRRLMRTLGNARFADLARPMRIVAGNLATLERVVFSSGEVAAAVHASSAVPGVCVPVTIDGETYIDGGIVDPLPVDVLREMGVARIIAVNAIPGTDLIRSGLKAGREPARPNKSGVRKLFRKFFPVNQQLNYFARGNLLEILLRSIYGAQIRLAESSCQLADVVLRPTIYDDRWLDYRQPGKFIALGREAAERHLEEIKALVAKNELNYERELAPEPVATIA